MSTREINKARAQVGAERKEITVSDKQWEAIQSGAISENVLTQIINNINIDKLRQRATPRENKALSSSKISRINSMKASGYTTSQIAEALGVSSSTVIKYMK